MTRALIPDPVDLVVPRGSDAGSCPAVSDRDGWARALRIWRLWLIGAVLFCAGHALTDEGGSAGQFMTMVMPLLFTAATVTGAVMNRPAPRWPWLMLAALGPISVVGYGIWLAGATTLALALLMLVFPVQAAALLLIVRGASWRQDRAGLLDAAMLSVGLGMACWLLVVTPLLRVHQAPADDLFAVLFPFGDVLLLAVLIRFFTSRGLRNAAFWQISASLLLQTLTHLVTLAAVILALEAPDLRAISSLSAFLLAGAAVHPSMRDLTGRPLRPATEMTRRRLLLINLSCMAAPALLLAQGILQHGHVAWVAAGVGCMMLFGLVALRMADLVTQIQDKARRLDAVAHVDALTTLPNRRAWDLELQRRIAGAHRHGTPVVIAIIDIDHFKKYNDEFGHQGGDDLLSDAGTAWRAVLRPEDLLARYGGEEFGAIFDHSRLADADEIIERLQAVTPYGQTFSAGAAQWNGTETTEELLARADAALYAAKRAGRNRCYIASTR